MILDDLCLYLTGNYSLVDGTNLFAQELPDTPDKAVVIREYTGQPSVETMGSDLEAVEVYGIQVVSREVSTPTARTLAHKVHRKLRLIGPGITMNSGVRYLSCLPNQMPTFLAVDDDQRVEYVGNYTLYRDPPATIT